jgi:uncharacterized protein YfaS (alpha-2-macroglobulin family)
MRTTLAPFVALLLPFLAVFLPGCRPPNPESTEGVRLSLTTAELQPDSNFEVAFDEPMVGFEQVGQTSSAPILRIEPALPGQFVWRSRRSGLFTPSQPTTPGAAYQFTLATGLTNLAGKPSTARLQRRIEVGPLQVDLSSGDYWPEREMAPFPEVRAGFNAPVAAAEIARRSRFTDGTTSVSVEVTEANPSVPSDEGLLLPASFRRPVTWREQFHASRLPADLRFDLTPNAAATNQWYEKGARYVLRPRLPLVSTNTWRLELDPGLQGSQDPVALRNPAVQNLGISAPFELTTARLESNIRLGRSIHLRFSRGLDPSVLTNDPTQWFDINPKVAPLRIEGSYDGRGITLRGNFQLHQEYTLRLATNLPCAGALPLVPAEVLSLEFDPIRPNVWLGAFDTVQLAHGHRELALLGVNTPEVRLRLKRLNRHTLIHAVQAYQHYLKGGSPFSPDSIPPSPLDYAGIPGQTVLDTNFPLTTSVDLPVTRTLVWDQLVPGRATGAFFIEADLHGLPESDSSPARRIGPQSIVQLTDLGIASKVGRTETLVWIFSHRTAQPVAGARVLLCTHENEFLKEAVTDAEGLVRFPAIPAANWLLVEKGDDLHAQPIGEPEVALWGFGIRHGSDTRANPRLFAFTDREAYRPGEDLRLRLFARSLSDSGWNFPTNRTVQLEVFGPREDLVLRTNLPLSSTGDAEWSWRVPQATRGTYSFNLAASDSTTSLRAEVREFQPAAFEVSLENPQSLAPGRAISVPVRARYLFGQPLAHANVTWSAEASDARFEPDGWKPFQFGTDYDHHRQPDASDSPGRTTLTGKAVLTDSVPLTLTPDLPGNPLEPGPQSVEITAEVTDLNQQTIVQSTQFTRDSSDFYLGFQWADGPEAIFATNAPLRAHVVAVRRDGQPWTNPVTVDARLFRIRWKSVATIRAGKTIGFTSRTELEPSGQFNLQAHTASRLGDEWSVALGSTPLSIPSLNEPGAYQLELRATDPDGRPVLTSSTFHVSGDARVAWHNRNGLHLEMVADKKTHQPGETATLLLKTPFSGTAWVTLERENVSLSYITNFTGNAPALQIPVNASNTPNTFVGVTLVRGAGNNPHQHPMPEWRIGYHELAIPDDSLPLQVQVSAPTNGVLPGTPIDVSVLVSDSKLHPVADALLTLYAVDEGYLQLKGTAVPDPVSAFEFNHPLEVSTALSLPLLLEEDPLRRQFANKGYIAGGGGRSTQNRRKFIPCPLWNTDLRTDSSGRATTRFTAPDSLTRYRIVAIATHGPRRMGSGATSIEIRKPLMIESALPRFAHVGDQLSARALVINTSPSNLTVNVRCVPGSNARFEPAITGARQVTVPPGGIEVVEFLVHFTEPGKHTWIWSAESEADRDAVEVELPVTHSAPAEHAVVHADVPPAGGELLRGADPAVLEAPESISLRIASSPLALVGESVRQLIHYPYGCVEQTGSSLLPWIALRDHPRLLPTGKDGPTNATTVIQAGVQRFWSMQARDGGLAYWPGSQSPQRWGSAYATWILALAAKSGTQVDTNRLARLHSWLNLQWKQDTAPYPPEVLHERCLTAFALAYAGAPEPALNDSLVAQVELLSSEDRSLLAVALLESGNPPDRVRTVLNAPAPKSTRTSRFGNNARELAIQLLAQSRLEPAGAESQRLTQALVATQRHGHWNTTQGNAWALWALAGISRASTASSEIRGEIKFHDRNIPFVLSPTSPVVVVDAPLSTNDARLRLSHSGTAPILVQVDVTSRPPASPNPTQAVDRGFRIQRSFASLDSRNQPQPATALHVGDRVLVTLTIDAPESADWIAIEDPIAAILEPVQGAFRTEGGTAVAGLDRWSSDFQEVRADRMLFFRDALPEGRHTIRYLARVRAAGDAIAAPCRIEAMYDPERSGLSASTRLQASPAAR